MILSRLKCLRRALWIEVLDLRRDQDLQIFERRSPSSGLTPSWARLHPAQKSATVVPIGVTTPMPVTTTRRGPPDPVI